MVNHGAHLIKWSKVSKPNNKGELGIGNVELKVRAFLAIACNTKKQIWCRYLNW